VGALGGGGVPGPGWGGTVGSPCAGVMPPGEGAIGMPPDVLGGVAVEGVVVGSAVFDGGMMAPVLEWLIGALGSVALWLWPSCCLFN